MCVQDTSDPTTPCQLLVSTCALSTNGYIFFSALTRSYTDPCFSSRSYDPESKRSPRRTSPSSLHACVSLLACIVVSVLF